MTQLWFYFQDMDAIHFKQNKRCEKVKWQCSILRVEVLITAKCIPSYIKTTTGSI